MELELKKEKVRIHQLIGQSFKEMAVEADTIVPDQKPDIKSILQIDAQARILGKEVSEGKVVVSGEVDYTVLYSAERDDDIVVKSLNVTSAFTHVIDIEGTKPQMMADALADVIQVDFNMIHSRRLALKSTISIGVSVYSFHETELLMDMSVPMETKVKEISADQIAVNQMTLFHVIDKLNVPDNLGAIIDVLKVVTTVVGQDCKLLANKLVIRGSIKIYTLFESDNMESKPMFMEHELPFTEILDIDGLDENQSCNILYDVSKVEYVREEDADGEARILGVDISVNAQVVSSSAISCRVIDDCYKKGYDTQITRKKCRIDCYRHKGEDVINIKQPCSLPNSNPTISQVYCTVVKPFVRETRVETGRMILDGYVDCYILYLSEWRDAPVYTYKTEIPFSHTVDNSQITEDMFTECSISTQHVAFSISNTTEIEVRANLKLSYKIIEKMSIPLITDVTLSEKEEKKRPSITIYFADHEDSLWDIAKRYDATMEEVLTRNQFSEDVKIHAGMQVMI